MFAVLPLPWRADVLAPRKTWLDREGLFYAGTAGG